MTILRNYGVTAAKDGLSRRRNPPFGRGAFARWGTRWTIDRAVGPPTLGQEASKRVGRIEPKASSAVPAGERATVIRRLIQNGSCQSCAVAKRAAGVIVALTVSRKADRDQQRWPFMAQIWVRVLFTRSLEIWSKTPACPARSGFDDGQTGIFGWASKYCVSAAGLACWGNLTQFLAGSYCWAWAWIGAISVAIAKLRCARRFIAKLLRHDRYEAALKSRQPYV